MDTLPPPPPAMEWRMDWHDEFDGRVLDPTKWQILGAGPRGGGVRNGRNVALDGQGHLVVSGTVENGEIAGAGVDSRAPQRANLFRYGYFVTRARIPQELGISSSFWLQTRDAFVPNSPTHGTEIDVLEYPSRDGRPDHNLHWNNYQAESGARAPMRIDDGQFHTFAVWWTPTEYRFYVDGRETWRTTDGGVSAAQTYILLTTEPIKMNPLKRMLALHELGQSPARFVVDYVRVYTLKRKGG